MRKIIVLFICLLLCFSSINIQNVFAVARNHFIPRRLKTVYFSSTDTASKFLSYLSDESISIIELTAGTYYLPYMVIDIDRANPVVVKPVNGAKVVFSGSKIGGDPQFMFGEYKACGNIKMQGFIFDGYILAQQGIIQANNCHNITLNNMVVRNCKCNGTCALPYHSWALYLSETTTVRPVNFTANNWDVDCSNKEMGGFQCYGGQNITLKNWNVKGAYYAAYISGGCRGPVIDNLILDGWAVKDSGATCWGHDNVSIAAEYVSGTYSNITLISSGEIINVGTPRLIDGGNNSVF